MLCSLAPWTRSSSAAQERCSGWPCPLLPCRQLSPVARALCPAPAHPSLCPSLLLSCQLRDQLLTPRLVSLRTQRLGRQSAPRPPSRGQGLGQEQQGPAPTSGQSQHSAESPSRGSRPACTGISPGRWESPSILPCWEPCGTQGKEVRAALGAALCLPWDHHVPAACAAAERGLAGDKGQSAVSGTELGMKSS